MPLVRIIQNNAETKISLGAPALLHDVLAENGFYVPHLCAGKGTCKKCEVTANGERVLSCRYSVAEDTVVVLPEPEKIVTASSGEETGTISDNMCLCLDIGTTTLALALVSLDEKKIVRSITSANPQRAFGADVISRIEYCMKNGTAQLREVLVSRVEEMKSELFSAFGVNSAERMYVSGNTTMLHIFKGEDPSGMGVAPYTPAFLSEMRLSATEHGIANVGEAVLLPGVSAFVGADILAGIDYAGVPEGDGYRILLDLGTNAEIALFSKEKLLCTAAAAGPCFEGANISCGMSAADGAICAVDANGDYTVIGGGAAKGVCATGLIDAIAEGVRSEEVDESGYLEEDELYIGEGVALTARDVREFQLAKSAIRAALECLVALANTDYSKIEGLYVAGGFSEALNVENAVFLGLIPEELAGKFHGVNNSSLLGAVKYACTDGKDAARFTEERYVNLSENPLFSELFMEYMTF